MTPPTTAGWNLALRFGLEVAALVGLGVAAWNLAPGWTRWVAVLAAPLAAATVWGLFNVIDDPSRSGAAPIEVTGLVRLAIELAILVGGAMALAVTWRGDVGVAIAALIALHYAVSFRRIDWLVRI